MSQFTSTVLTVALVMWHGKHAKRIIVRMEGSRSVVRLVVAVGRLIVPIRRFVVCSVRCLEVAMCRLVVAVGRKRVSHRHDGLHMRRKRVRGLMGRVGDRLKGRPVHVVWNDGDAARQRH